MEKPGDFVDAPKHTILIVDDNPANLSVVVDYLATHGFQVMVARDGEAGLRLAQQDHPDLILLDVLLPGIDGFEACRRLKVDERTREIPVIFMTIVTRTEDKVRGFEVGGMDYITKPFEHEEVLARVSTHLRLRDLTQKLEEAKESLEQQVVERTSELAQANVRLKKEIAERKQAEQNLVLVNFALNNVREAAFLIDENARFHFVNDGACSVLGYTRAELLGLGVQDVDPDFPPERWSSHWNELRAQRSLIFEGHHKAKDGRIFPVEIYANYFEYDSQSYNLALVRDITERKQTEEALRQSEGRFRRLTENARDVIYRMSLPDGRYEYISPAVLTMLGYPPEDYYANPLLFKQALHPDWHKYFEEQWINLLNGEMLPTYEYQAIHKSGTVRWFNQRNILVLDGAGKPIAIEGIVTDITDRKRAEEEIRQLNRELEQRVANRTAQIEAANKELEAFAYSISHDLRAPLRHIDGFVEMLKNRTTADLDDQSRHYMDVIADSARKMGMLIDDLLAFSRVSRSEISKAQVDLGELIQEVIREAQPETEGRNIQWKIALLPRVTGDQAMLRVVMTNLILNALKFTRPRPVAEIEIGYKRENETEVAIFVRDNGVGFDMAYADKLFGVFQRLHQQDDFEGTGIGLANVRRIINRHGGRTWADGKVDHGATFYFSLPISEKDVT
ncbi:MAG TPA: PAS domain S-box protein [Anaerolineales bacterium]|nr:PAS domain S-box protein [Anaerolineales bacterium]